MFELSLQDILGTLYEATDTGYKYKYELGPKELSMVLTQLDLTSKQVGDSLDISDNDDDEDNQVLGKYSNGVLNTDIKVQDYLDLKVVKKLVKESHIKKDGSLDMRKLLGKATKKYQSLVAQGTYATPVAGDVAGSPTNPDSSEI